MNKMSEATSYQRLQKQTCTCTLRNYSDTFSGRGLDAVSGRKSEHPHKLFQFTNDDGEHSNRQYTEEACRVSTLPRGPFHKSKSKYF